MRPGPSGIKKLRQRFFYFKFLVLNLFYRSPVVTFNENYHFPRIQSGWNIFQGGGGVQLFPGESNCFFPIETYITCDFPLGSGPPAPTPLDPPM